MTTAPHIALQPVPRARVEDERTFRSGPAWAQLASALGDQRQPVMAMVARNPGLRAWGLPDRPAERRSFSELHEGGEVLFLVEDTVVGLAIVRHVMESVEVGRVLYPAAKPVPSLLYFLAHYSDLRLPWTEVASALGVEKKPQRLTVYGTDVFNRAHHFLKRSLPRPGRAL